MKLPTHIISSVKWFEHEKVRPFGCFPHDRFTLHFHQWWKPRKVIQMEMTVNPNSTSTTFISSQDALELLAQLKRQCPDQA